MPAFFSQSSGRVGITNNNHKTYFIFTVWGRRASFSLATTFKPAQANQLCCAHTPTHTHYTHVQTLSCAVLPARVIVRVITCSVVCLVTFSLYELGAVRGPSILSIDRNLDVVCACVCFVCVCGWLLFSFYHQRTFGPTLLCKLNYLINTEGRCVHV